MGVGGGNINNHSDTSQHLFRAYCVLGTGLRHFSMVLLNAHEVEAVTVLSSILVQGHTASNEDSGLIFPV